MLRLWRAYTRFLQVHPFKAQATNTCVLMGTGDVISQQFIEKRGWKKHNVIRTCRQALFGFAIAGPLLFTWFSALDRVIKGKGYIKVLKMVAIDQSCMPPFFLTIFFTVIGFTSGLSTQEVKGSLRKNFVSTLITNYKIWPAAQLINFYFVPLQHRLLFANFVALFWNTYLSWKANAHPEGSSDAQPSTIVDGEPSSD